MNEPTSGRETLQERLRKLASAQFDGCSEGVLKEAADALDEAEKRVDILHGELIRAQIARDEAGFFGTVAECIKFLSTQADSFEAELKRQSAPLPAGAVEHCFRAVLKKWNAVKGAEGTPVMEWAELAVRETLVAASLLRQPEAAPEGFGLTPRETTNQNIFAYTGSGPLPPYCSINLDASHGVVIVTVRSKDGRESSVEIPATEWRPQVGEIKVVDEALRHCDICLSMLSGMSEWPPVDFINECNQTLNRVNAARVILHTMLASAPKPATPASAGAEEAALRGVKEALEEGDGIWRTCSGCYETVDGHPAGHYPHSKIFNCTLGAGCNECGGIGAVWDTTDYAEMGEALSRELDQPESPSPDAARNAGLEEAAKLIENGFNRKAAYPFRADGVTSKLDQCIHKRAMNEDCEQCCADAIRALSSAPAPASGQEELRDVLKSSLTIQTSNTYPPIPDRRFDWCAWFEGREEEGPFGWGITEAAALRDLLDSYPDDLISRLSQIQESAAIAAEHEGLE
jgi:hypothetical protein